MKHLVRLTVCHTGKISYLSEDHAKGAVIRAEVRGVELRTYWCQYCKGHHVAQMKYNWKETSSADPK